MSPKYLASTELCFCVIALPVLSLTSILMNNLKLANPIRHKTIISLVAFSRLESLNREQSWCVAEKF